MDLDRLGIDQDEPQPTASNETSLFQKTWGLFRQNKYRECIAECSPHLKAQKECAGFWAICGLAHQKQGEHPKAIDNLRAALALGPSVDWVHHALAISLLAVHDQYAAISHFQMAVSLKKDSPEYFFTLGSALKSVGNYSGATLALQQALSLSPTDFRIHYELGAVEHNRHRIEKAIKHYSDALSYSPNHIPSLIGQGAVLCESGRFEEGLGLFQRAIDLAPQNPDLWLRRASALFARGIINDGVRYAQKSIQLKPGLVDAHVLLGKMFASQGKTDQATKCFENALRMDPGNAHTMVSQAVMLERGGATDAAREVLESALSKIPNHPQLLLLLGRIAKTEDERRDAIRHIESRLNNDEIHTPQDGRSQLYYTLGNLHDRLNEPEAAFLALERANTFRNKIRPFSRDRTLMEFNAIRNTFTAELMENSPRSLVDGEQMIFILGMPRSGTSLAEQILSSHPDVYGAGELTTLDRTARWWPDGDDLRPPLPYPSYFPAIDISGLTELSYRYLNRLPENAKEHLRVTDKMPYNFLHIGMIALLFPRARIIHCVRDPIDTTLSCYMQDFLEGNAFSNKLEDCGWFFNQYRQMMAHWKQVLPSFPIIDLSYETLVDNPEDTVRTLLTFCGLDWNSECLQFHKAKRVVNTASYQQVREPLYKRSVARWKRYAPFIQSLIVELELAPYADSGQL